MICLTCVDALLGTDMERICKKAQKSVGIPVLPCYMYALTREGRKPPMVHVRQSIYSLLEPRKKKSTSVNLLGHFAPLEDDCELYDLLKQLGVKLDSLVIAHQPRRGEYVPGTCTHRPSSHESRGYLKYVTARSVLG